MCMGRGHTVVVSSEELMLLQDAILNDLKLNLLNHEKNN